MLSHGKLTNLAKSRATGGVLAQWRRKLMHGLWMAVLAASGCAVLQQGTPKPAPGTLGAGDASQATTVPVELDELTRAFADRYVGLLASTCDALKKDNHNAMQRREAQELLLNAATNVYDIASNADAFTRMLDLVVVTTLVSQVWIDDDRAGDVFGDREELLVRALHHGRVEAWALAAQVLRPDQLDLLDYLIWDWRRRNPDMVRASFVRFSNFAVGRGKSADAEVLAAGGFFTDVGQAGKAVDEARLLTERMFYLFKREPTLLRWMVEAMKDDMLATPDVGTVMADMHRVTDQIEQVPKFIAAERQAVFAAIDERLGAADVRLGNLRAALTDTTRASDSLKEMLKTAESVFTRFDAWDRWSVNLPGHRAFDIREYVEGVKDLTVAVGRLNNFLKSSDKLLGSSEWDRRMEQLNQSANARMKMAAEQSQRVIDAGFRQLYMALGGLFGLLILYRVMTLPFTRRVKAVEGRKGVAP